MPRPGATVTLVHSLPVRQNKHFDSELLRVLTRMAREEIASAQARAGTNFAVTVTGSPVGHSLAEIAGRIDTLLHPPTPQGFLDKLKLLPTLARL